MDSMTDKDSGPTSVGPFNIGLDPGFGGTKAVCIAPGGAHVAIVPSVVGVGQIDLGLLSVGNLGRRRRSRQPDQVSFGERTYLVGENVARYSQPVERMDFLRLSDGPELRALFYDVVFRLLGEACPEQKRRGKQKANASAKSFQDTLTMNVLVGLPVQVMADREQARATLQVLRRWIACEHSFAVNGRKTRFSIASVLAMAQPAGTFFAWGLNDQGKWTRPGADLKAPVAVCDIGFCTLDLFVVEGGEVVGRFTSGDTVGMRRAAELVINGVRSSHGIGLSLHEADALVRQRQPRLHTAQGEQNLRSQVEQALDTTAAAVVSFVERHWGNGRQFTHLLFTGGGAEALREPLLRQYPHGVVLPDAVTANALGLARYAARVFHG